VVLASISWTGAVNNDWGTPGNWSGNVVPGGADDVTIDALSAASVNYASGTRSIASLTVLGDDVLTISGGSLTVLNGGTVSHLNLAGGSFIATGEVTLSGSSTWFGSASVIDGSVVNAGTLTITGQPDLIGTLRNSGTILYGGRVDFGAAGHLQNLATGTLELTSPGDNSFGSGAASVPGFSNAGKLRVNVAGTHASGAPFHNLAGGEIEVVTGILALHSNGTWEGAHFVISAGAQVTLNAGTKTWTGSYTGSGQGQLQLGGGVQGASAGGQITVGVGGASINFPVGFFEFAGNATIAGTGVLTNFGEMRTSGFPNLSSVIENSGAIIASGRLDFSGNGQINNLPSGVMEIAIPGGGSLAAGTAPGIFNAGTIKLDEMGTSTIGVPLHNSVTGIIEVVQGTLSLNTNGMWTGGTFVVSAGAEAFIGAGTKVWSGVYTGSGAGKVRLGGGTQGASAGGTITIAPAGATFDFSPGQFEFSGNANLGGAAVLNTGNFSFVGRPNLNGTLNNAGEMVNTATIDFGAAGRINNLQGGTFETSLAAGGSFASGAATVPGFFNAGTFRKTGAATVTTSTLPFHQLAGGTVEVIEGEMTFASNGSWADTTFQVAAAATARLSAGTKTITGTFSGTGGGTVRVDGGTITVGSGGATFAFPAPIFTIAGGPTINGAPLQNTGDLNFAGDPNLGTTLSNSGVITMNGRLDFVAGGRLHNLSAGTIELLSASAFSHSNSLGLVNDGLIRKASAGATAMGSNVPFTNAGTVEVTAGTLNISTLAQKTGTAAAGVLNGGTWIVRSGGTLDLPGTGIVTNNATIIREGTGALPDLASLNLNNGSLEIAGGGTFTRSGALQNEGTIVVTPGSTLAINGAFTQDGGRLELQISGPPESDSYGRVSIAGAATFGGTLAAASVDGFAPGVADGYTLITYASQSGSFTVFEGGGPPYAPILEIVVNSTELRVNSLVAAGDLAITGFVTPAGGTLGEVLSIEYTVTNLQNRPVPATAWTDTIYFSRDQFLDPTDFLFARIARSGGLDALQAYTEVVERGVPSLPEGEYFLILTTDARSVAPDVDRSNNRAVSSSTIELEIASLALETPITGTIQQGQDIFYKLQLPAGTDVFLNGEFENANAAEFLVRFNALPTRSTFDFKASSLADIEKQIRLINPRGGTYYLMLHGREGAVPESDFTLTADSAPFVLDAVGQNFGANAGLVTIPLLGAGFETGLGVELRPLAGGSALLPENIQVISSGQAFATFDLVGIAPGDFSVVALQDGAERVLADSFDVVAGELGRLEAKLIVPASVRQTRPYTITVEYENRGGTDIPVPLLIVKGSAGNFLWAPSQSQTQQTSTLQFLGGNPVEFTGGVLRPGEKHTVTLNAVTNGTSAKFTLNSVGGDSLEEVDYAALRTSFGIAEEQPRYQMAYDQLVSGFGATYGELIRELARGMDEARLLGDPVPTFSEVFDFLVDREMLSLPSANVQGTLYISDATEPARWPDVRLVNVVTNELILGASFVDGKFSFFDVPSGEYKLVANGFLSVSVPTISVSPTEVISGLQVVADPGETLTGVVKSVQNSPVRDGLVTVVDSLGRAFSTTTDVYGRYEFKGLAAGAATLNINAAGVLPVWDAAVILNENLPDVEDFTLGTGSKAQGRILSPGGLPLAGALVTLRLADSSYSQTVTTGFDGRFRIGGLPTGSYQIEAAAEGFGAGVAEGVLVGGTANAVIPDLSVTTNATVRGVVTDAETGLPIAGAQFVRTGAGLQNSLLSNAQGVFEGAGFAAGTFFATVNAHGYISKAGDVTITPGETGEFNVSLRRLGQITGTVLAAGVPAPGQKVTLFPLTPSGDRTVLTGTAGPDGTFAFSGLHDGDYALTFFSDDASVRRQVFTLNAADNTHATTVESANGTPLLGEQVTLFSAGRPIETVRTDAAGIYRFFVLQAGPVDIIASGEKFGVASVTGVNVPFGQAVVAPDLIASGGTVTVDVDAAAGNVPLGEASVTFVPTLAALRGIGFAALTNAQGSLELPHLPAGEYKVLVNKKGYATEAATVSVPASGAALEFDLIPGRTIQGVVRDSNGAPIDGAKVTVVNRDTGYQFTNLTLSDGSYLRNTLVPGNYDVYVSAGVLESVLVSGIVVAEDPVNVDATLGTTDVLLRGTLTDSSGTPVAGATIRVFSDSSITLREATTDANGNYTLANLSPGAVRIAVAPDGYAATVTALTLPATGETVQALSLGEPVAVDPSSIAPSVSLPAAGPGPLGAIARANAAPTVLASSGGVLTDYINDGFPPPQELGEDGYGYRRVFPQIDSECDEQFDALIAAQNSGRQLERAFENWKGEHERIQAENTAAVSELITSAEEVFRDSVNLADSLLGIKGKLQELANGGKNIPGDLAANIDNLVGNIDNLAAGARRLLPSFNSPDTLKTFKNNLQDFYSSANFISGKLKDIAGTLSDVGTKAAEFSGDGDAFKLVSNELPFIGDIQKVYDKFSALKRKADAFGDSTAQYEGYFDAQDSYAYFLERHKANRKALEEAIARNCSDPAPNPEEPEEQDPQDEEDVPSIGSRDPNDILGPAGFGAQNWIAADSTLAYTIRFENVPTATAAAQLVTITHQLDADVDTSTFQLGNFGFGDFVVEVPEGRDNYTARVDARDLFGVFVDVEAELNVFTGVVTWTFSAIDPESLEFTADPVAGFLPPNITGPEGEGFVSYSIRAAADSPTGTVIDAQATIVFDQNEPINTPAIFNTLDGDAPSSTVASLPATVFGPKFTIQVSSGDGAGSGVQAVDIYVSDNGGPFTLFMNDFTGSSVSFRGVDGHTYGFATIAKDNVGRTESLPSVADTFTTVDYEVLSFSKSAKLTFTDADGDVVTVRLSGNGQGSLVLDDIDGDGRGSIDSIVLAGTDAKSNLTVTVKKNKNGGDGIVTIGDVTVNGSLGAFTAKQSDLVLGGFSSSGATKSLNFRDLLASEPHLAEAAITVGGGVSDKLAVTLRNVADGFTFTSAGIITSLRATAIGEGEISGAALGKLNTTLGGMNANLAFTGAAGGITIKTGVNAGEWSAASFGVISVGTGLHADVASPGSIAGVKVKAGALSGNLTAASFGAISVTGGDLSGDIVSTSTSLGKKAALAKLTVIGGDLLGDVALSGAGGNVTGVDVTASKIAAITVAKALTNSAILAGTSAGPDRELGGGDDTFSAGAIGAVKVGGDILASVIAAGLSNPDGIFDNADDSVLGGSASAVAGIIVKGTVSNDSYFAAGRFKGAVKFGAAVINPAADARFSLN
jgi:hypothetical protein